VEKNVFEEKNSKIRFGQLTLVVRGLRYELITLEKVFEFKFASELLVNKSEKL
jgi:hypothetical protein